jgi:chromosome segregation ATPase
MSKERTKARAALAAAINQHIAATADLNDARSASSKASEHLYSARTRLAELKDTHVAPASSDAVIAGIASGDFDIATLDRPAAELHEKIERAHQDISAWERARDVAQQSIKPREEAIERAQRALHDAAINVLKESVHVAQLADELDELQERVIAKRLALKYLFLHGAIPDDDKQRVESLLNKYGSLPLANFTPVEFVGHPTMKSWENTLINLMANADAAIPGET